TVRTLSARHGRAMARFQPRDAATAAAFRAAAGAVEFTVDAGKVNTREQGWKDLKIGVFQKRTAAAAVSPGAWQEQRLPEAAVCGWRGGGWPPASSSAAAGDRGCSS